MRRPDLDARQPGYDAEFGRRCIFDIARLEPILSKARIAGVVPFATPIAAKPTLARLVNIGVAATHTFDDIVPRWCLILPQERLSEFRHPARPFSLWR